MTIAVPFFDWPALYAEHADRYAAIMHETASRGAFILQRDVVEFEEKLARYLGIAHVVALSDATNAMQIGLRACGIETGDEVILPSHGFIAAAQAIHYAGGIPVPVELNDTDWLVDPAAIEAAITPRTRAIMPVHVNGRVCDMAAISDIASRHGLAIYEDAAQAVGARLRGAVAGSFGAWGAFSFYPSKTLGCFGEGGALATNDPDIADRVRRMRNHGAGPDKIIPLDLDTWGTNARMDNISAAILNFKMDGYVAAIDRRRAIARQYDEAFRSIAAIRRPPPPVENGDHWDIFQNYEMRVGDRRDALRAFLAARGIGTIVQWGGTGLHQFRNLGFTQHLPRTDAFFAESLLIPMNHILTDQQVAAVISAVSDFFSQTER